MNDGRGRGEHLAGLDGVGNAPQADQSRTVSYS